MHHQRKLRIATIQALFQFDVQGDDFADKTEEFLRTQELSDRDVTRTNALITLIRERMGEIDGLINGASEHWDLQRITPIDRAILRLAICELLFVEATPPKVAINEAIELAKTFGEAESPHFVNGLLDAIWKKSQ
jgi:N utilization substance protein B